MGEEGVGKSSVQIGMGLDDGTVQMTTCQEDLGPSGWGYTSANPEAPTVQRVATYAGRHFEGNPVHLCGINTEGYTTVDDPKVLIREKEIAAKYISGEIRLEVAPSLN